MSDDPGHVEVPQSWTELLADQLEFHWSTLLRPKLEGLTDDEFHWEPVAGCWGVRRREESTAPIAAGSGAAVLEFAIPEPDPPPVTTIARRLAHLTIGCFGQRNASHFGGSPIGYQTHDHPTGAAEALAEFDAAYEHWIEHVKSLDESALWEPVGEAEGPFAALPMAGLVLHIHREVIHHGAEILLLRQLYAARATDH